MNNKNFRFEILIILYLLFSCNVPASPDTSNLPPEVTPISQVTVTTSPENTPTVIPSPTIIFTPIPIQQLASNTYFNFTQPLSPSAQITDPNTVSGVIYNGYGPVINAFVGISKTYCGELFQEVKVDSDGRYVLTDIQPGIYYLQVETLGIINFCGEEVRKSSTGLVKDIVRPRAGLVMIFPRDGQTVAEIRPTIEWKAVANASYYVVELTYQTSGEPGWDGNWTGKYLGTWLTNQTTFTIPFDLNKTTDYKLNIISYTNERLPLAWAFEIRFHY